MIREDISKISLSAVDVTKILGCSSATVYLMVEQGKLHPIAGYKPFKFLPDEILLLFVLSNPAGKNTEGLRLLLNKYEAYAREYPAEAFSKRLWHYMLDILSNIMIPANMLDEHDVEKMSKSSIVKEVTKLRSMISGILADEESSEFEMDCSDIVSSEDCDGDSEK